jgi:branched-chain amino acid transport system permease protein
MSAPVWTGMLVASLPGGACGFVIERFVIRRFYAAPVAAMPGTYALALARAYGGSFASVTNLLP